ncbi:MAG: hypothetical protein J6P16_06965 [Eubacterium sp.]|nr:hypothetical protein [Eubacterium sp.]
MAFFINDKTRISQNGYYTVEATFIVTICITIIMAVLYTGLYVHDRMEIETISHRQLSRWVHMKEDKKYGEDEFVQRLRQDLDKHLFLLAVTGTEVSDSLISTEVRVRYSLPVTFSFLRRIWGGDDGEREEEAGVYNVYPARLKWDMDAIRSGG